MPKAKSSVHHTNHQRGLGGSVHFQKSVLMMVGVLTAAVGTFLIYHSLASFPPPVLIAPTDGATTNNAPTLQWGAVSGANQYKVQVAHYDGNLTTQAERSYIFSKPNQLYFNKIVRATQIQVATPSGSYYWRVRVKNSNVDFGAWSPILKFTAGTVTPPPNCTGSPLTDSVTPQSGATYCGGRRTKQTILPNGVTWSDGEVTGASAGDQRGAVECTGQCTLNNLNVHDNINAFAALYLRAPGSKVIGGKYIRAKGLGIGDDRADGVVIDGAEVAYNNSTDAISCGYEAGGIKLVARNAVIRNNFVHHNNCKGIWFDISGNNALIEGNRVEDNTDEGIFYEISDGAVIRNNIVKRNGLHPRASGTGGSNNTCQWLWGGGITNSESNHVSVYGNTLEGNCNGITGVSIGRPGECSPACRLDNFDVYSNSVTGAGNSGVAADDGVNLPSRNINYHQSDPDPAKRNQWLGGHHYCGFSC